MNYLANQYAEEEYTKDVKNIKNKPKKHKTNKRIFEEDYDLSNSNFKKTKHHKKNRGR